MYDLIIKGGTVIDSAQGIHGLRDVAVEDGKIALVAEDIPASEAQRVVEVKGKIVTAGLIDLHTHVYDGVNGNGVKADLGGVRARGLPLWWTRGVPGAIRLGGFRTI